MQVNHLIDQRIAGNQAEILALQADIQDLENQKATKKSGIASWLDFRFESSSGLTEEFASFYRDFKKHLKQELSDQFELIIDRGHFEAFGFVKNKQTGKYAYFSISDVRFWQNEWYEDILIRTAKDDKDYTGGSNNSTDLLKLRERLLDLTS